MLTDSMTSPTVAVVARTVLQTDGALPSDPAELEVPLFRTARFVVAFTVVLLIGWIVVEPAISRVVRKRNKNNPTIEEAITRYLRLVILLCGLFVGISAAGFATVVGSSALVIAAATLALGIAGQSVIGSFVSGMALVIDPEFNVGDYIRWEGGEGRVISITLRITRVRTVDGGLVTIPNTVLTEESIVRPFERGVWTVEHVAIGYDDDVEAALGLLSEIVGDLDGVLEDPAPRTGVEELGDDAVILRSQFWIDDPMRNTLSVRSTFIRAVKERFERAGIEISPASQHALEGQIRIDIDT